MQGTLLKTKLLDKIENWQARLFSNQQVYHYHIRKTAGTSINFAFLRWSGAKSVSDFYESLAQKENHRLVANGKTFVGWNVQLIQGGRFSYAFSHEPSHVVKLPDQVIRFTCFRDPMKRIISHYNMLCYYEKNNVPHPCMAIEGKWIVDGFRGFLEKIEKQKLFAQLYMFSKEYSIDEAVSFLLKNKVIILNTESLSADLKYLSNRLGCPLSLGEKEKDYGYKEFIDEADLNFAKDLFENEYKFLHEVDRLKNNGI